MKFLKRLATEIRYRAQEILEFFGLLLFCAAVVFVQVAAAVWAIRFALSFFIG